MLLSPNFRFGPGFCINSVNNLLLRRIMLDTVECGIRQNAAMSDNHTPTHNISLIASNFDFETLLGPSF